MRLVPTSWSGNETSTDQLVWDETSTTSWSENETSTNPAGLGVRLVLGAYERHEGVSNYHTLVGPILYQITLQNAPYMDF